MGSTSESRLQGENEEFRRIGVYRSGHFRIVVSRLVVICCVIAMLLSPSGCGNPPALGSESALSAADALYTAITSRRVDLMNSVENELKQLQSKGQLSAAAMASLTEIIEKARSGSWQNAAEDLDGFIRNQPVTPERSK